LARYGLDRRQKSALQDALDAMTYFSKVFGRSLDKSVVAELLVADSLGLKIVDEVNRPGFDAVDQDQRRYQIKYRAESTLNVDVNNFDFDYLILVNLDSDFQPVGMWKLSVARAKDLFVYRRKFRKHQATQTEVKRNSQRIL
jgi:hypothetical protein